MQESFNKMTGMSHGEAMSEIHALEDETQKMGAQSDEHDNFEQLRAALHRGDITPEEAVVKARILREGKQDYH